MPHKILVVDDDVRLQKMIARYLNEQGFLTTTASDAVEMHLEIQRHIFQLYILDINLPGEDGLQICQRIRSSDDTTPIIMLTARGEDVDRIVGLEMGADDYLAKPFNPRELLARVRSVLRRHTDMRGTAHDVEDFRLEFGEFVLDASTYSLTRLGRNISMNRNEFALLKILVQHPGQTFSRTQLGARIYGREHNPDQRDIDMMISRIRKHLNQATCGHGYVQTVRGIGYVFMTQPCDE